MKFVACSNLVRRSKGKACLRTYLSLQDKEVLLTSLHYIHCMFGGVKSVEACPPALTRHFWAYSTPVSVLLLSQECIVLDSDLSPIHCLNCSLA